MTIRARMRRSPRAPGAGHHNHDQLGFTHGDNNHAIYAVAGQRAHSPVQLHTLEVEVRNLTHDLVLASFQIEALEEELDEVSQDIKLLREKNMILQKENANFRDYLDDRYDGEHEMMLELASRLEYLHEDVQDLNSSLQIVLDETCSADVDESFGYYFEGGWKDVARLWHEGRGMSNADHARDDRLPIGRQHQEFTAQNSCHKGVLQQQGTRCSHESMAGTANLSGSSHHFERSNAPSPEERCLQQTYPDMLRQIEMERIILLLQDRLEKTEIGMRDLTSRCDAQDHWYDLLVEMVNKHGKALADIFSIIYAAQEENDEDGNEDLYCTCGKNGEELGGAFVNATLRGGMGGRDEDEEFVYDYGGYTNWDEADALSQSKCLDESQNSRGDKEIIQELRRQIEHLEAQVRTLTEAAHRENHLSSTDPQHKEEEDVNLRGGSGEEKLEVGGGCECTDTGAPAFIASSPHLLCQRATYRSGDSTINYIIVYLPPGFVSSGTNEPELVLHSAATIYYFPAGAREDVVQQEAWKQKSCGTGHWQDVQFHKLQFKQIFKRAIADMWETMGLSWDVLTRGDWNFDEDEGDMYMVNDKNLFLTNCTREGAGSDIRGGSGDELDLSIHTPVQTPSLSEMETDEFNSICEHLMQEAARACVGPATHQRGDTWTTLASVLHTRNCFLERELENFKEINHSLIQDLHWQMDAQVEMEERLETAVAEKDAIAEDFQVLKTRLRYLIETTPSQGVSTDEGEVKTRINKDHAKLSALAAMRGGDQDLLSSKTSTKDDSHQTMLPEDLSRTCTTTLTTNSFEFYPKMSTIVFAGALPCVYQFPYKSTLPDIRSILEFGGSEEMLCIDPYIARILEIMKMREEMGIQLPDDISDERVTIGIHDIPNSSHLDRETKIVSWQIYEEDVKDLEKLVKKLEIGPSAASSFTSISTKATSSEGEKDYYHDVGDLIHSLNDIAEGDAKSSPRKFCTSKTHPVDGREGLSNIPDMKPHMVSVRGGDSDSQYWSHDANGNREFPLHYLKLPTPLGDPPNTQRCYGTFIPDASRTPEDEEITTSKGPLSMQLGRLMFPAKFIKKRENSISRFDWQHTEQLNPQFKDKSSRGFTYTGGIHCESWAIKLDEHREHCDYCHAVFLEEEYTTEKYNHRPEHDLPKRKTGVERSWEKSIWPGHSDNPNFSTVEHSDPCLRGGAGQERDLEYHGEDGEDGEELRSEWDHLASQTQCSGCQPRTFRNSSTLSTNTTISPPSPVDRSFRSRRQPQPSDICTAEEFLRTEPWIPELEHLRVDLPKVRAGESYKPLRNARHKSPDNLTPSKTSNLFLLEIRRSRHEVVLEGSPSYPETLSIKDSDSVLGRKAEDWLENARPAPPLPFKRHTGSPWPTTAELHNSARVSSCAFSSTTKFDPVPRELSFRSDRYEFFPASACDTISEDTSSMTVRTRRKVVPLSEMLSDEVYEEYIRSRPAKKPNTPSSIPTVVLRLCKRCAELLTALALYITKLRQRLILKRPKKNASKSACQTPSAPERSQMSLGASCMNREIHPLRFDKSLPPTPRASMSTLILTLGPKEKFPAAPILFESDLDRARAIAQAQDRAHAEFVSQAEDQWHVPTIAGPSDLIKEALMWLAYEAKPGRIEKKQFDGYMTEDMEYEHPCIDDLV